MNVKLFTHTDLDGVGCGIVAGHYFGEVDAKLCDYHEINDEVMEFIEAREDDDYDRVYITDISVDAATAEVIDEVNEDPAKWQLIDHHATALWLNKYEWAHVKTSDKKGKTSGTSLLYDHLYSFAIPGIYDFAEKVRRYDTWEWATRYFDQDAKELNDLLYILGKGRFIDRFMADISLKVTPTERLLLDLEREKIEAYIERKAEKVVKTEILGYKAGVVFADRYQSELGNALNETFPSLDFIAMINPDRSVSLRTIHDHVEVNAIAKQFGGGGHPKAAGFGVPEELPKDFVKFLFEGDF